MGCCRGAPTVRPTPAVPFHRGSISNSGPENRAGRQAFGLSRAHRIGPFALGLGGFCPAPSDDWSITCSIEPPRTTQVGFPDLRSRESDDPTTQPTYSRHSDPQGTHCFIRAGLPTRPYYPGLPSSLPRVLRRAMGTICNRMHKKCPWLSLT